MEKSINIQKFTDEFQAEYNFLYDNHDNVVGYDETVEAFDDFAESHGNFIKEFVQYRGDFISSDREAAAFMFAMEKYLN